MIDVPDPRIADNYAKVKVVSSPLCTEFKHDNLKRRNGFGHEAAAEGWWRLSVRGVTSVTHRFPLDQIEDVWELQMTGSCGRVVLHPWG